MASTSNIEILERFQSKTLRMIVDAPWYLPNTVIRRDFQTPKVKEEIRRYSSQYSDRLSAHPNGLVLNLMELPDNRRLRGHLPNDRKLLLKEESYRTLFYMPLYTFLHNSQNVLVQIADKMGLHKICMMYPQKKPPHRRHFLSFFQNLH
jgi:hypothetical protein